LPEPPFEGFIKVEPLREDKIVAVLEAYVTYGRGVNNGSQLLKNVNKKGERGG